MTTIPASDRPHRTNALWALTAVIVVGMVAARLVPSLFPLLIVVQVVFLVLHGGWRYGWRAIGFFIVAGLVISNIMENLSVETGFPFGQYHYTGTSKIFHVPWHIGLAYLATGYLAWIVATNLLADIRRGSPWLITIGVPVVGAVAMTAWDLPADPIAATIRQVWIWENGGGFFGVPVTNFLGWTLTVYLFMQTYALYLRSRGALPSAAPTRLSGDVQAVILYAATSSSSFASYFTGERTAVTDATGKTWQTGDIYETGVVLAIYGMFFLGILALLRIAQRHSETR